MKEFIALSCYGSKRYELTMCNGTTNVVCYLHPLLAHDDILDYLDKHCKLFDNVIDDINIIGNIIGMLNRHRILADHIFKTFHDYISVHKYCGLYMFIDSQPEGLNG